MPNSDGTKRCFCSFTFLDMIEDRVRSRFVSVLLIFSSYAFLFTVATKGANISFVSKVNVTENITPPVWLMPLSGVAQVECMKEMGCLLLDNATFFDVECNITCLRVIYEGQKVANTSNGFINSTTVDAPAEIVMPEDYVLYLICLALLVTFYGNSSFHQRDPLRVIALPLALVASVVVVAAIALVLANGDWNPVSVAWTISAVTACFYFLYLNVCHLILCHHRSSNKAPPKAARDFADVRLEAYETYCRNLMIDPGCKARAELAGRLQKEGAMPMLSWQRRAILEKEVEADEVLRFGYFEQLKRYVQCSSQYPDAVFIPVRIYAPVFISIVVVILAADVWCKFAKWTRDKIVMWDYEVLTPAINEIDKLTANLEGMSGVTIPQDGGLNALLRFVAHHIHSFGDSWQIGMTVGCVVAAICITTSTLVLLADFRSSVLQARRGVYNFNPKKIYLRYSFQMTGAYVSNALFNFIMISLLCGVFILLLSWSLTWYILGTVHDLRNALINFVAGYIGNNYVLMYALVMPCMGRYFIKERYWWMFVDFSQTFIQLFTGATTAVIRFLLALVVLFFALSRVDKSLNPEWIDDMVVLDTMVRAYRATVMIYHQHSNPVLHVFISILKKDSAIRRSELKEDEDDGYTRPNRSRKVIVINRWRKWRFLLKNPAVVSYRCIDEELETDSATTTKSSASKTVGHPASTTSKAKYAEADIEQVGVELVNKPASATNFEAVSAS